MSVPPPSDHFRGQSVVEHLKQARARGAIASAETHGTEIQGHLGAAADASKEMAFCCLILWIIFSHYLSFEKTLLFLILFSSGFILWKTARSAFLGWTRIERLHRVIEEERWEIEHHRQQERLELTEMYQAKGLTGKLLEEVIDVLMADDNRLLRVMLEEELGLTLEAYEHPLKQAAGALCGSVASSLFCLFGLWAIPAFGIIAAAGCIIFVSTLISTKLERNKAWITLVWNLSFAGLTGGCVYFLMNLLENF